MRQRASKIVGAGAIKLADASSFQGIDKAATTVNFKVNSEKLFQVKNAALQAMVVACVRSLALSFMRR